MISTRLSLSGTPALGTANSYDHASFSGNGPPRAAARAVAVGMIGSTEKYFGTSTGLTIMKGVEYGETHYEIEGMKKGKKVEVTFDPEGKKGK